jgi:23S rRNA (uridine2552-2'-O)-methyltransferase
VSSWRQQQGADRFFRQAKEQGYRARSAFKLLEIDQAHGLLRPGAVVLDVGAAPGSWSQVAARKVQPGGRVVAVDLRPIDPIPGVLCLQGDLTDAGARAAIAAACAGPVDLVLCDAAPDLTGIRDADAAAMERLVEAVLPLVLETLRPGGAFLMKVFAGAAAAQVAAGMRDRFARHARVKPAASHKESREQYYLGLEFRPPRAGAAPRPARTEDAGALT